MVSWSSGEPSESLELLAAVEFKLRVIVAIGEERREERCWLPGDPGGGPGPHQSYTEVADGADQGTEDLKHTTLLQHTQLVTILQ